MLRRNFFSFFARARSFCSEPDLEALYYLSDVRCVDKENLLGFTLEFHFDDNPYFTNAVLTKRYDTANIMDQVCVRALVEKRVSFFSFFVLLPSLSFAILQTCRKRRGKPRCRVSWQPAPV